MGVRFKLAWAIFCNSYQLYSIKGKQSKMYLSYVNNKIRGVFEILSCDHYILILSNEYENIISDLSIEERDYWISNTII